MRSRGSGCLSEAGSEAASNFGEEKASAGRGCEEKRRANVGAGEGSRKPESIEGTKFPVSSPIKSLILHPHLHSLYFSRTSPPSPPNPLNIRLV